MLIKISIRAAYRLAITTSEYSEERGLLIVANERAFIAGTKKSIKTNNSGNLGIIQE